MTAIFRRNDFFTQLLLLPYVFIVRLFSLLEPQTYSVSTGENEIQRIIFTLIPDAIVQNIAANLLIFVQALLINAIAVKHRLMRENTMIPAAIYILAVSVVPQYVNLSPGIIANLFIILAVRHVYSTYKVPTVTVPVYMTGFYLSLGAVFYQPYLIFIVWGFIAITQLRKFRFLEIVQFLSGYITPGILLGTYRILNGKKPVDFTGLNSMSGINMTFQGISFSFSMVGIYMILLATTVIFLNYVTITGRKNIQIQKKYTIQFLALLFAICAYFFLGSNSAQHLLTLSVPLAFLAGVLVSDSSSRLIYEFLHLVFLACALSPGFMK